MYLAGEDMAQDDVEAHRWFNLSGVAGNEGATTARDLVAARMTPEQLAEAAACPGMEAGDDGQVREANPP